MIQLLIATLIFVISALTLLQFFVSYCHSIIAESRNHELSEHARDVSGVTPATARGDQFQRLVQLLALCPEPGGDKFRMTAMSRYFDLLGTARKVLTWAPPATMKWIESERGGCTYVAAVMLDRRIAYSRMLMAQQTGPLL